MVTSCSDWMSLLSHIASVNLIDCTPNVFAICNPLFGKGKNKKSNNIKVSRQIVFYFTLQNIIQTCMTACHQFIQIDRNGNTSNLLLRYSFTLGALLENI